MSIESLGQLESKIQNAIDTIALNKMEVEELREAKTRLEEENAQLKQELQAWTERVSSLIGKLDSLAEEAL
ncbi:MULTISPECIES: cell division protein ZapB [Kistimonas]|uniref:Cell division protein ZapB n=1 Tax=Kistimonas scapharcae TaxID=1036133 RepID=A0ABP8V030_9GAMM|nr:cell division protein ZapB [Kistimonas asteriae]OQX38749.1 MAG: cell division protein ZapB [Oceanospirillales bacterium LUC14_002_19_P2]